MRKLALAGERAQALVSVAARTVESGVRNVAIIDYYLKHVSNERQLTELDRWLAEEVLSATFGGHRKGNFARISFAQLRAMGLPSLVHRRRLLLGRRIESAFFIWQTERKARALQGMVARRPRKAATAFSSHPEAAAQRGPRQRAGFGRDREPEHARERGRLPVDGRYGRTWPLKRKFVFTFTLTQAATPVLSPINLTG